MANANRLTVVRDPAKPRKLGRYELEECLGVEGSIETFRARVRGLAGFDRIFAVKCLRRGRGGPINLTDPFIKVAKRTASINDPRVARVLDADVIDGVAIAVTEFVHGLDLDRFREWAHVSGVLATGTDASAEKWQKIVAYVGAEVAGGLAALHALTPPLVHGGLCPRNIIATARGGVKVLDVGLRQSAPGSDEQISPRALAYAAPDPSSAEPNPQSDMRALGVVLFELATGELPPSGAGSLAARKILDALWPSMADFVAGLLAEDPALRPSAAEAAKILGDFWSEIPDASMVAEMAVMVRNFSGFVADSNAPHTPQPLPIEPGKDEVVAAPRMQIPAVPPLTPHAPSASGSFLAAGDVPTRAMPSGSYASAIFQAVPTDASVPNFTDETIEMDLPADALVPSRHGVALDSELGEPPAVLPSAVAPTSAPAQDDGLALSPLLTESTGGETTVDPVPIPELAEWGAQALAALGDQAGVAIQPLVPVPESVIMVGETHEVPPPPVSDPVIEEAFAFIPPPPAAEIAAPPARSMSRAVVTAPAKHTLLMSAAQQPLEDELIDDPNDPDAIMASAFVARATSADTTSEPPPVEPAAFHLEGEADQALEVTAFTADEDAGPGEWEPPRLAHAMAAPEADEVRGPTTRTARRSGADSVTSEHSEEKWDAGPSRVKRVALIIAILAGIGGAVAAAVVTMGPKGKKDVRPALPGLAKRTGKATPPSATAAAPVMRAASAAPSAPLAKVVPKASHASATSAATSPAPAPAAPALLASKPTGSTPSISVPIASKPEGAMVWIDGEERGKTPCTVKLKPGSARLALVHAGYLSSQSSLDVREDARVDATLKPVSPPMEGDARFRAECKTEGKLPIVVDGKETGILCPYSKMRVEPGSHTIGVLVPSTGKVHDKEITLSAGVRSINFGD